VSKAKALAAERPFWVSEVNRQLEGGETVIFKEKFQNWSSSLPIAVGQTAAVKKVELMTGKVCTGERERERERQISDAILLEYSNMANERYRSMSWHFIHRQVHRQIMK
jgi:hypothetical protein